jgi:Mn2+/Fe2+ NRAMP family transporter
MSKNFRSLLFWSIIAAAFIGPGTVTTAARAGHGYGLGLLWALVFSIIATIVLQEAAARLTLGAGKPLGEIIGAEQRNWNIFLFGAVALGCGAYQAGNLLGALAGLQLLGDVSKWWLLLLGVIAAGLLWSGSTKIITRSLATIVVLMGIVFCWVAFGAETTTAAWLSGLVPKAEEDSALLVIGLIGTTIVPYNLFLASGLSKGQDLREMRTGLLLAILIGGGITLAIMLSGTLVSGAFGFPELAAALDGKLAGKGSLLLGLGLFTAGLSSAITAPLAAAIAGQSLVGKQQAIWGYQGKAFRLTWGIILLAGLTFALTDVKPVPAIIAAQALNGLILPLVAVFLLLKINDAKILMAEYRNPLWLNLLTVLIVGITVFIGLQNIWSATGKVFSQIETVTQRLRILINLVLTGVAIVVMMYLILRAPKASGRT